MRMANFQRREHARRRLARLVAAIITFLIVTALLYLASAGRADGAVRWYWGHSPQWLLAIDADEISIGPSARPIVLRGLIAMLIHVAVFAVPMWGADRVVLKYFRGRQSDRAGLCPECGYDLRASQPACPECGRNVAPSAKPADGISAPIKTNPAG